MTPRYRGTKRFLTAITAATVVCGGSMIQSAQSPARALAIAKNPIATGFDGAVATGDAEATRVGIDILRAGGNAVDAAVAAAAALGVTEPFANGLGGGGFLLYFDAKTGTLHTINGRETAPAATGTRLLVNPGTGRPYQAEEARVSGLSVGVPGTPMTWQTALDSWGSLSLSAALAPAIRLADHGFTVDATFQGQVLTNLAAFGQFDASRELFLPGGRPPVPGSIFRNPDLAASYRLLAEQGVAAFYSGALARDIVRAVRQPPVSDEPRGRWPFPIRPGGMRLSDLAEYRTSFSEPTHLSYRGLDVYGAAPPSSGGATVGEALNILQTWDLAGLTRVQGHHRLLEATALAFADRDRYVAAGTPSWLVDQLLSADFAAERSCLITATRVMPKPAAPGVPDGSYGACPQGLPVQRASDGMSTTHLTVADRWGNVAAYTLTINDLGGSAMVVPGRGFLLNNELQDFEAVPTQGLAPDPNLPGPGKQPRSSMSPTIVLRDGKPFLALGSPGGSTIITTVTQLLINQIDFGMTLPEAIAAPRASQPNTPTVQAEPDFVASAVGAGLARLGHRFTPVAEIGAATAIEFPPDGSLLAAAEPLRRGGGTAAVVRSNSG